MRQKEAYGARRRKFELLLEQKKTAYSFLSHTLRGGSEVLKWILISGECSAFSPSFISFSRAAEN